MLEAKSYGFVEEHGLVRSLYRSELRRPGEPTDGEEVYQLPHLSKFFQLETGADLGSTLRSALGERAPGWVADFWPGLNADRIELSMPDYEPVSNVLYSGKRVDHALHGSIERGAKTAGDSRLAEWPHTYIPTFRWLLEAAWLREPLTVVTGLSTLDDWFAEAVDGVQEFSLAQSKARELLRRRRTIAKWIRPMTTMRTDTDRAVRLANNRVATVPLDQTMSIGDIQRRIGR